LAIRVGRVRAYKYIYVLLALAGLIIALHPARRLSLVGLLAYFLHSANDVAPRCHSGQTMLADEHHSSKFAGDIRAL
jgi:hypothetical protein